MDAYPLCPPLFEDLLEFGDADEHIISLALPLIESPDEEQMHTTALPSPLHSFSIGYSEEERMHSSMNTTLLACDALTPSSAPLQATLQGEDTTHTSTACNVSLLYEPLQYVGEEDTINTTITSPYNESPQYETPQLHLRDEVDCEYWDHDDPASTALLQAYQCYDVDFRPEDLLPEWPLEAPAASLPLTPQDQPQEPQYNSLHAEQMEYQYDNTVHPIAVSPAPANIQEDPYIPSNLPSSYHISPFPRDPTPSYSPYPFPVHCSPSPTSSTLNSPLSLSSSSEVSTDSSSPYYSTMESEPEWLESENPVYFQEEPALELDQPLEPNFAEPTIPSHQFSPYADPTMYAQGRFLHAEPPQQAQLYASHTSGTSESWNYSNLPCVTEESACENGTSGNYYEHCNLEANECNMGGCCDGENCPGSPVSSDTFICTNAACFPRVTAIAHHPRANFHQVLEELNAFGTPALQNLPARTQQDYAQYHNAVTKLGRESECNGKARRQNHREDFRRMVRGPQLFTEFRKVPPSSLVGPHANRLRAIPTIDSDAMAKFISNRKAKRNIEMDSEIALNTIISGSKVIRLTHSYQQQPLLKPEPATKRRKTKKELIEHIQKQIPEFRSSVPPYSVPKAAPTKKPTTKAFWKQNQNNRRAASDC